MKPDADEIWQYQRTSVQNTMGAVSLINTDRHEHDNVDEQRSNGMEQHEQHHQSSHNSIEQHDRDDQSGSPRMEQHEQRDVSAHNSIEQHSEPDQSGKNSTNSTNSTPTHRQVGGFAPGNPWRFKRGQCGNPKGRPRRRRPTPLSDVFRDRLTRAVPQAPERTYAELIGDRILGAAVAGDMKAINAWLDRTEGRPRQTLGAHASCVHPSQRAPEDTGIPLGAADWINLRKALTALEPFPEARNVVMQTITEYFDQLTADDAGDNTPPSRPGASGEKLWQ